MPPTIPISFGHSTPLIARTLHDCVSYINNLQTRKLVSNLGSRNYTGIQDDGNIIAPSAKVSDTTISDITLDSFAPYEPSFPLHPSIVPASTASELSEPPKLGPHSRPHINTTAIVITFSAAFTSILCGLSLVILVRWLRRWNLSRSPIWFSRRNSRNRMTDLEDEPIVSIDNDYAGWTVLIRDTTKDLDLERKDTTNDTINETSAGPPGIPPSTISTDSLALCPDYSTPAMTDFQQLLDAEEADITMAIGIAMRDCTYSGSELSTISQGADKSTADNYHHGWENKNRARKCSDASDSTKPTTESDDFSIAPTTCSSSTSIMEIPHISDFEELNIDEAIEMETGDMIFEVVRAQAQSMEIKRGVLFSWCGQRASLSPVLEEMETSSSLKSSILHSNSFTTVPSLVVTCPSMMTIPYIRPSFSSVSVDLNDFPLPPSAFSYGQPFDDSNMCMQIIPELDDIGMGTRTL